MVQMKRAVSGSGVIIVRVVAAAITLDDRGIQLPSSLMGAPVSLRDGKLPCFICLGFWWAMSKVPLTICHLPSVAGQVAPRKGRKL